MLRTVDITQLNYNSQPIMCAYMCVHAQVCVLSACTFGHAFLILFHFTQLCNKNLVSTREAAHLISSKISRCWCLLGKQTLSVLVFIVLCLVA